MASPSPSVRFFGILDQSPNNGNPLELEESDVVWSSSSAYSIDSDSHSPPRLTGYPITHIRRHRSQLNPPSNKHGLSAALSFEQHTPLVLRKSALNPSLSATSAAKTIPPVFRSDNSNLISNKAAGRFHQSAPVNVPVWPKKKTGEFVIADQLDEVEDEVEDEEEMVPPHVIVARSHVTRSVFEGVGRTLKGRDLRRVRNAVFEKTASRFSGVIINIPCYTTVICELGFEDPASIQLALGMWLIHTRPKVFNLKGVAKIRPALSKPGRSSILKAEDIHIDTANIVDFMYRLMLV